MDVITLVGTFLGGGFITALTSFLIQRKKTDQDGFKILFDKLEEDNRRLREREDANEIKIQALQKQLNDLQLKVQLMESAHNDLPIPQWLKDTHGRMLSINDPYIKLTGISRDKYIGNTDWDVWPENIARQFIENDNKVMREKKPMHTIEKFIVADGSIEEWNVLKFPRYAGNIVVGIGGIAFKKADVPE